MAFSTSNRRSSLDCQANQRIRATTTRTTAKGSVMTKLTRDIPKEPEQEPVATMPSNTRYTVEVEGRGHTYWDNIHDAITNAQRAVYSGPDNTTRALDDLKAGRIAEWSYGFSAVRIYPPQDVASPQRKPLAYIDLRRIASQCGLGANEVSAQAQAKVDNFARAIEAAHGIKEST